MKHGALSFCFASMLIFLSLGLESHGQQIFFYFPVLWLLFYGYFTFHRSLQLNLLLCLFISILLSQFTVLPIFQIFLTLAALTCFTEALKNFFTMDFRQRIFLMGPICFIALVGFDLSSGSSFAEAVNLTTLLRSLGTGILAPLIFFPLHKIDQRFRLDPLDSMEIYI